VAEAIELEPGERVLATARASFRGAAAATLRGTFTLGSARHRNNNFDAWRSETAAVGFPTAKPEMVLCLTNQRLILCETSFWLNRPSGVAGALPLSDISDVAIARHGLVTGLALAITHRGLVQVEAMRGRQLRRFGKILEQAIAERAL
jgi:hypothetical protein